MKRFFALFAMWMVIMPVMAQVANQQTLPSYQTKFVLPQIQEFWTPLRYAPGFGTTFIYPYWRRKKDIEAYWERRKVELEQANQQCLNLSGETYVRECLANVRNTEIRKSESAQQSSQQTVQAHQFQQFQAVQMTKQIQQSAPQPKPVQTNCQTSGYGYSINTSCYSY